MNDTQLARKIANIQADMSPTRRRQAFQVGDRVASVLDTPHVAEGILGTVTRKHGRGVIDIAFDNGWICSLVKPYPMITLHKALSSKSI